jgi:hypothetical protein
MVRSDYPGGRKVSANAQVIMKVVGRVRLLQPMPIRDVTGHIALYLADIGFPSPTCRYGRLPRSSSFAGHQHHVVAGRIVHRQRPKFQCMVVQAVPGQRLTGSQLGRGRGMRRQRLANVARPGDLHCDQGHTGVSVGRPSSGMRPPRSADLVCSMRSERFSAR